MHVCSAVLAKSYILGMTVFGTYEYLILHHKKDSDYAKNNLDSSFFSFRERSSILAHFWAGACAGLAQSSVMIAWELASKVQSHHALPHNLRIQFVMRRAVHHSIGYASLFGTYEATRRLLLHSAYPILKRLDATLMDMAHVNHTRDVTLLVTSFVAGGIAGQVHQFVSYVTSHWKLQVLTEQSNGATSLSNYAKTCSRLPTFKSNLSAFAPTGMCFVAFQYGSQVTARLVKQYQDESA